MAAFCGLQDEDLEELLFAPSSDSESEDDEFYDFIERES